METQGPLAPQMTGDKEECLSSTNLTNMTDQQLIDRLEILYDASPEEESVQELKNCQKEIKVIEAELEWRKKYGTQK